MLDPYHIFGRSQETYLLDGTQANWSLSVGLYEHNEYHDQ